MRGMDSGEVSIRGELERFPFEEFDELLSGVGTACIYEQPIYKICRCPVEHLSGKPIGCLAADLAPHFDLSDFPEIADLNHTGLSLLTSGSPGFIFCVA